MPINRNLKCSLVLSFVVAFLSVGCSTTAPLDGSKVVNTAEVKVTGEVTKLLKFDTKLRSLLGVGNDDSDTLACRRCAALRGGDTSIDTLIYLVSRKPEKVFGSFAAAWNDVWYDPANPFDAGDGKRLVMTIDYDSQPPPSCSTMFPPPPTCYDRPRCPSTGYCSENQAGDCQPKCGT